mmetsp:Transcript_24949/g.48732  ORF Transcript_24949/g.48732 Transcript_24949/m.48732 type:complete len:105 (-) Transcript_24949:64-378(-)
MPVDVAFLGESPPAEVAGMRLDPEVSEEVFPEILRGRRSIITKPTPIPQFPLVDSNYVQGESLSGSEDPSTQLALENFSPLRGSHLRINRFDGRGLGQLENELS